MTEIKPVPIQKKEELQDLIQQLIEERKYLIVDKLKENDFKDSVITKIIIADHSYGFVIAVPRSENPDWLKDFLKSICIDSCNQLSHQ